MALYLRPIALVDSPQAMEGRAVRLAGGLAYASHFALIRREGARVVARQVVGAGDVPSALAALSGDDREEAQAQWDGLRASRKALQLGARQIRLDQPQVMGILNITPDSFSDGGRYGSDLDAALAHAGAMQEAGAAIIDIGGESTRPNASPVWEGDEIARVAPVVEKLSVTDAAISVDTRRVGVMEAALAAGAESLLWNDVSALRHDPRSLDYAAKAGIPVGLMHAPGRGEDLHADAHYSDVVLDVFDWLRERRDTAEAAGIARDLILLDPGIGFGKSLAENLALMNALPLFHALGCPLLVGASRKRMIGALSHEAPADQRLGGSLALALQMAAAGVQVIRVHDVAETAQALRVWRGMRDAALTDFSQIID
jgi:dihydropteroate synthase